MATAITNVRIFDGESVLSDTHLVIKDQKILSIGGTIPNDAIVIDASGGTVVPGLLDSHVHTQPEQLRMALRFGVTTELEMMGFWTADSRKAVEEDDNMADLRTAGFGMTAPGGHPSELIGPLKKTGGLPPGTGKSGLPGNNESLKGRKPGPAENAHGPGHNHRHEAPTVSSPEEAVSFVADRVTEGSDYIKIMIEEGSVFDAPGLPLLSNDTVVTAVKEAHAHSKLAIAHALTAEATTQAINAGVDGLAHLFIDGPHTTELLQNIANSGAFVTPCLCVNASIMGRSPKHLTADIRITSKMSPAWQTTLAGSLNTYPQGNIEQVLATVGALHKAGVDILAGSDASFPVPHLGGVAHGVSVHHELQLLVAAGMTPIEALKSATALPAKRFGLSDRGKIAPGLRADLLLVDGDPTRDIGETLNVKDVWRRGKRLETITT
ncbi:hypothetical protein BP5796_11555 [Coleophoma crateriformis]|uniref:Amidohydrolase-related domain-containing protein n=1 Tax=Coleophoma crateriformis TaxID=565419 RepID=A0A3D8QIK8_9HELO|nr:hypothetical protein BP5796_11555 [Coleophoma crateriformis]